MRILLVEDEIALADALQYILEREGYQADAVYDGAAGEDHALSGIYDAIVLDRMLPKVDGLDILKAVRAAGLATPVMFLTAKDTVLDRVDGLDAGADDYLIKPFSNREFLARVRALTRRSAAYQENDSLTVSNAKLNIPGCVFTIGEKSFPLTRTETQLLELLMRNKGIILSKDVILDRIWGLSDGVEIANVELYIYYLRKKIDFSLTDIEIKTIRGIGYSLIVKTPQEELR